MGMISLVHVHVDQWSAQFGGEKCKNIPEKFQTFFHHNPSSQDLFVDYLAKV